MTSELRPDTTDPRVGTTVKHDDWTVRVSTESDHESSPDDDEGMTAQQLAAYMREDWGYVGLIVKVSREGVELGVSSLWGIEYGYYTYTDEDDNVLGHGYVGPYTEAVDDCIAEAIEDAKATLSRLCASAS